MFDAPGKLCDGGRIKKRGQRDIKRERSTNARNESRCQQRIATKIKEVGVATQLITLQDPRPERR